MTAAAEVPVIDPNDLLDSGSGAAEALGHLLGPMEDDRMIGPQEPSDEGASEAL
jgi:hypothetical protein